jgi:hypothetical protein
VTNLDLNNDGIVDFQISNKLGSVRCGQAAASAT